MTDTTALDTFWFDDGNVILDVRDTQFRVHRGVLGRLARVFQDMWAMPQPRTEEGPVLDGCPVIPLDDDHKDWKNLLNIIYNCDASYLSRESFNISSLASALRLGRKYQFDHIHDAALERIKLEIPSTLDEWDDIFQDGYKAGPLEGTKAIDLLNLLLELDNRELLPVAYCLCLHLLPLELIFRGGLRDDGTIASLSAAAIEALLLGKDRIMRSSSFRDFAIDVSVPVTDCSSDGCKILASNDDHTWPFPDAEHALLPWEEKDMAEYCSECQRNLRGRRLSNRKRIWNSLPVYFGIEPSKSATAMSGP